jgi:hypothetical protein
MKMCYILLLLTLNHTFDHNSDKYKAIGGKSMIRLIPASQRSPILSLPVSNNNYSQKNQDDDTARILILHSGKLFDDLIAVLLREDPDLNVSIDWIDREEAIAQVIASKKPQIVILYKSVSFSVEKLKLLLEMLHYTEALQIVTVSINENSLEIANNGKLVSTNFNSFVNLCKSNVLTAQ